MPRHQVQDIEAIMAIIVSSIDYTLWRDMVVEKPRTTSFTPLQSPYDDLLH